MPSASHRFRLLLCVAAFAGGGCASPDESPPPPAADVLWLDVRTPDEFRQGHAEGAILIPYTEIAGQIQAAAPDKGREIRLYCRSGRRSGIALRTLQEMGYRNVANVGGLPEARRLKPFTPSD
jgi:phage shock protein E